MVTTQISEIHTSRISTSRPPPVVAPRAAGADVRLLAIWRLKILKDRMCPFSSLENILFSLLNSGDLSGFMAPGV